MRYTTMHRYDGLVKLIALTVSAVFDVIMRLMSSNVKQTISMSLIIFLMRYNAKTTHKFLLDIQNI